MRVVLMVLLVMLCGVVPVLAEEGRPIEVQKSDKCPVCGMFVAKYPDFAAKVIFEDGTAAFFDGNKDMFKYLLDLSRYNPAQKGKVKDILVTDYYGIYGIDGRNAWYVEGSDVYGPMGRELISFALEADAVEFANDHQGKKILRFGNIDDEVMRSLD